MSSPPTRVSIRIMGQPIAPRPGQETNNSHPDAESRSKQRPPAEPAGARRMQAGTPPPKVYPNNTLVEDLSRCHANLWPGLARSVSKTSDLVAASGLRLRQIALSRWLEPSLEAGANSAQPAEDGARKTSGENLDCNSQKTSSGAPRSYEFQMPSAILALNSTLTPDDYNRALCVLTSDIRYKLHLLLFRHLQTIWALFSTLICVLVPLLLFPAATVLVVTAACASWLLLQIGGLVACKSFRKQLDKMLERSVAQVNTFFMDHNLMLGVINAGGLLTETRFVVPLLFFDASQCIDEIGAMIESDLASLDGPRATDSAGQSSGATNQRVLAQRQLSKKIVLSYSQRWISRFDRSKLLLSEDGLRPRHLSTGKCLCQFIEENLKDEPRRSRASSIDTSGSARDAQTIVEMPETNSRHSAAPEVEAAIERRLLRTPTESRELSVASLMQLLDAKTRDDLEGSADEPAQSKKGSEADTSPRLAADSGASPASDTSLSLVSDEQLSARNEELFKSLKLLLEFRSNELSKSFDSSSTTTWRQQMSGSRGDVTIQDVELGGTVPRTGANGLWRRDGAAPRVAASARASPAGRKFFARVDGLLALGAKKRQHQRGLYACAADRPALDVC